MLKLLTLAETAERLRKTEATLRWLVHKNAAPPSALIGGRRMFTEEGVDAWVEAQFEKEGS